jgi:hypothetical protein
MAGETAGGVLLPVCVVRAGVGTVVMVLFLSGGMAVVLLGRKISGCQNKRYLIAYNKNGEAQRTRPTQNEETVKIWNLPSIK